MMGARMRLTAGAAVLAIVAGLGVVATGSPAAAAPVVTVTPTTGLLDRQPVAAGATGLAPSTTYALAQCGSTTTASCARPTAVGPYIQVPTTMAVGHTDAAGVLAAETLLLRRSFTIGDATWDCAAGGCSVGLLTTDGTILQQIPITFAATGTYAWPDVDLTVTPASGLVEHDTVHLATSGLNPRYTPLPPAFGSAVAWVDQCRAVADPGPADCRRGDEGDWASAPTYYIQSNGQGVATGTFPVHRFLALPGGTVDCAVEACTVAVRQGETRADGPVSDRVPISFGPEWAPLASAVAFTNLLEVVRGIQISVPEGDEIRAQLADRSLTGAEALAREAVWGVSDPDSDNRFVAEATRIYRAFFGRAPDAGGLQYWASHLRRGMTTVEVARRFGGTPEFRAVYGTAGNAQVVERAYQNTLGRAPEPDGLAYWTGRLDQGLARWKMIHGFARAEELRQREQDRTAIVLLVWRLAGRIPTPGELAGNPETFPYPGDGSVRNVAADLLAAGEVP